MRYFSFSVTSIVVNPISVHTGTIFIPPPVNQLKLLCFLKTMPSSPREFISFLTLFSFILISFFLFIESPSSEFFKYYTLTIFLSYSDCKLIFSFAVLEIISVHYETVLPGNNNLSLFHDHLYFLFCTKQTYIL